MIRYKKTVLEKKKFKKVFCGPQPSHWKWQKKAIIIFFWQALEKNAWKKDAQGVS